jgi:NNP family nitrate/nitrite transporter-like MFS transporter
VPPSTAGPRSRSSGSPAVTRGTLAIHIGARRTGILGMALTTLPLLLGWLWADSFDKLLLVGLLLGVAGASFAAALPLASRWYPLRYQGLAMGIAGAGNSGTALATFFGPRLAQVWGWHAVFGLAIVPLLATLAFFVMFAKESPNQPASRSLADYADVLRMRDTWWFCLFYSITFGGFVGLASFLNIFFLSQYGLSRVEAGTFTTLCVVAGSVLRPFGGYLADRLGGPCWAASRSSLAASAAASSPSRSWAGLVARQPWPMRAGGGGVSSSEVAAWHWIVPEGCSRAGRSPEP